jgi:NAD-dependent SIR2 family protein deacetylase
MQDARPQQLPRSFSSEAYDKMLRNPKLSAEQRAHIVAMRERRIGREQAAHAPLMDWLTRTRSRQAYAEQRAELSVLQQLEQGNQESQDDVDARRGWPASGVDAAAELERLQQGSMSTALARVNIEIATLKDSLGLGQTAPADRPLSASVTADKITRRAGALTDSKKIGVSAKGDVLEIVNLHRTASGTVRAQADDGAWVTATTRDGKRLLHSARDLESLCNETKMAAQHPEPEPQPNDQYRQAREGSGAPLAWPAPRCVFESNKTARPGYESATQSEFLDAPEVLDAKLDHLVAMIRACENVCAYTGAGISTSAGIGDYASHKNSKLAKRWVPEDGPHSEYLKSLAPTVGHRVLTAMERAGHLDQLVNQNHDCLELKAGFSFAKVNQIHGSWWDQKNPVVDMDGDFRRDLANRLDYWEEHADLCLALGTSLSGLTADGLAHACAERAAAKQSHLSGLVIINLQKTLHDENAQLRIYAPLDEALGKLAEKLGLTLPTMEECERNCYDVVKIKKGQTFGVWPPPAKLWLKWFEGYYDEDHKGWKETELQCYKRAQPSREKTEMLKERWKAAKKAKKKK